MQIWRLEIYDPGQRSWVGPYHFDPSDEVEEGLQIKMEDELCPSAERPLPAYLDFSSPESWVCGCASARELRSWFEGYLPAWLQLGGRIAVYQTTTVDAIKERSEQQVVFDRDEAELEEIYDYAQWAQRHSDRVPVGPDRLPVSLALSM